MDEPTVLVRYLGDDVVDVPHIGVFQDGTTARVPRTLAFDLLQDDLWEAVSTGPPAIEVRLRIGQWDGPEGQTPTARDVAQALRPEDPADFGDLPSDGPPPLGPDEELET